MAHFSLQNLKFLEFGEKIWKSPWCPKFYGPKLQFDTKYKQIVFLVLAVEGGASDFAPSSRYNIVVSVILMSHN